MAELEMLPIAEQFMAAKGMGGGMPPNINQPGMYDSFMQNTSDSTKKYTIIAVAIVAVVVVIMLCVFWMRVISCYQKVYTCGSCGSCGCCHSCGSCKSCGSCGGGCHGCKSC